MHFDNHLDQVSRATSKLQILSPKFPPDFLKLEGEDWNWFVQEVQEELCL